MGVPPGQCPAPSWPSLLPGSHLGGPLSEHLTRASCAPSGAPGQQWVAQPCSQGPQPRPTPQARLHMDSLEAELTVLVSVLCAPVSLAFNICTYTTIFPPAQKVIKSGDVPVCGGVRWLSAGIALRYLSQGWARIRVICQGDTAPRGSRLLAESPPLFIKSQPRSPLLGISSLPGGGGSFGTLQAPAS